MITVGIAVRPMQRIVAVQKDGIDQSTDGAIHKNQHEGKYKKRSVREFLLRKQEKITVNVTIEVLTPRYCCRHRRSQHGISGLLAGSLKAIVPPDVLSLIVVFCPIVMMG